MASFRDGLPVAYLALDISKTRTGWAAWRPGEEKPRFGHWVLGSAYTSEGRTYCKLHECLMDLTKLIPVERAFIEAPIHPASLSGHTNIGTLRVLAGLAAHVHSFGAAFGISVTEINVASWRRDFIGPQRRGTRRQTLKALTIERCRQLGFDPRCDDEADALGVLDHALAIRGVVPPWRADEVLRPPLGNVA